MKLYVNGTPEGTFSASGNLYAERNSDDVYLGDYPLDGGSFTLAPVPGSIDSLRVSDIEDDVNAIFPGICPYETAGE